MFTAWTSLLTRRLPKLLPLDPLRLGGGGGTLLEDVDELGDSRGRGLGDDTDKARDGGGDGLVVLALGVGCATFITCGGNFGNSDRLL